MRRSWILTLPLSVIAATSLMSAAFGQPRIVQTDCDTLSVSPPRVRVQFRVENLGEEGICSMVMLPLQPAPPDTCSPPILQCAAPAEWSCFVANRRAIWYSLSESGESCIPSGGALDSFAVITDNLPSCCYFATFYAGLMPEPFFADTFCFTCDEPVPARSRTWGRLKLLYR